MELLFEMSKLQQETQNETSVQGVHGWSILISSSVAQLSHVIVKWLNLWSETRVIDFKHRLFFSQGCKKSWTLSSTRWATKRTYTYVSVTFCIVLWDAFKMSVRELTVAVMCSSAENHEPAESGAVFAEMVDDPAHVQNHTGNSYVSLHFPNPLSCTTRTPFGTKQRSKQSHSSKGRVSFLWAVSCCGTLIALRNFRKGRV